MERLNIKKKINKYFLIIVISILLIFGCLCLLVYKNQVNKQTETTENNSVENYINENSSLNDEQNKNDVFEKTEKVNYKTSNFIERCGLGFCFLCVRTAQKPYKLSPLLPSNLSPRSVVFFFSFLRSKNSKKFSFFTLFT